MSVVFSLLCRVIIDNVVFDGWSSLEWLMCRRATIGVYSWGELGWGWVRVGLGCWDRNGRLSQRM